MGTRDAHADTHPHADTTAQTRGTKVQLGAEEAFCLFTIMLHLLSTR